MIKIEKKKKNLIYKIRNILLTNNNDSIKLKINPIVYVILNNFREIFLDFKSK